VKVCVLIAAVLPVLAGLSAAEIQQNYLDGVNYGTVLFTMSAPPVRGTTPEILARVKETLMQRYQRPFIGQLQFEVREAPFAELMRTAAEEKIGFVLETIVVAHNEERQEARMRQRMMMLGHNGWKQLFAELSDVPLLPNVAVGMNPAEIPFLKAMIPMKAAITKQGDESLSVGIQVFNNLPFDVKSFSLAAEPVVITITAGRDPKDRRPGGVEPAVSTSSDRNYLVRFASVPLEVPSGKPAASTVEIPVADSTDRLRVRRQVPTAVIYGVVTDGKFPDGKTEEEAGEALEKQKP